MSYKFVKIYLLLVIFILFDKLAAPSYATKINRRASHSAYPGRCFISHDEIYEPGLHKRPEKCENIECYRNEWITIHNCGPLSFSNQYGPCEKSEIVDATVPYPECCKHYYRCKDQYADEYLEIH